MPPTADPTKTRLLREWKYASPLIGCRFDPSGRFLFVSAQDNSLQRFDLITGDKTALVGHPSWVRGMAFVPGVGSRSSAVKEEVLRGALSATAGGVAPHVPRVGREPFRLFSGDYHGQLVEWQGEADAPKPLRTREAHQGWVRAVAVSPDGKTVATCGNDHAVRLWSAADGRLVRELEGHACHVYNVAFHPDGTRLASADLKGVVKDWDLSKGTAVRELDAKVLYKYDPGFMADIGGVRGMAFSTDGAYLACAGITNVSNAFAGVGNPLVVLFDWKEGKAKQQLKPKDAFQGTAWGVAFHPAGFIVGAGGGNAGQIWFWKPDQPASFHTVPVPRSARDMALSPDGKLIAVACSDGARVYAIGG